ncbi:hypothetical protein ACJ73_06851 [Blastomyces percursus]|uniref:Uncharacterized protein n=1 Tax=Blastomyces percursus TaxID=1658174 RepID=A0A1J9PZN1_9EURO|nr:hypothetical protein ACJ73_06851 [Blastomyces percursus]
MAQFIDGEFGNRVSSPVETVRSLSMLPPERSSAVLCLAGCATKPSRFDNRKKDTLTARGSRISFTILPFANLTIGTGKEASRNELV